MGGRLGVAGGEHGCMRHHSVVGCMRHPAGARITLVRRWPPGVRIACLCLFHVLIPDYSERSVSKFDFKQGFVS